MQLAQFQELRIDDFSGGLTDNFIEGAPNQYAVMDNLLFNDDNKPVQRPGSELDDEDDPQISTNRVGFLIKLNDDIFAPSGSLVYYQNTTWTSLTGPTGNPGLGVGDSQSKFSAATWRDHLFLATDALAKPIKIYRDEDNIVRLRTAGLPRILENKNYDDATILAVCISLANT